MQTLQIATSDAKSQLAAHGQMADVGMPNLKIAEHSIAKTCQKMSTRGCTTRAAITESDTLNYVC